jgi:hypothetical protein
MFRSLRHWSPRALFLSWGLYWLALLAIGLARIAPPIWRATHGPTGTTSAVNLSFSNTIASLTVTQAGQTTWTGSISLITMALWVAVPPLVLWMLWAATRPRVDADRVGQ